MPRPFRLRATSASGRALGVTAVLLAFAVAAGLAAAATVTGSISGQITSVKGKTFAVKNNQYLVEQGYPSSSTVSVGKASIRESLTVSAAALKTGLCVTALGTSASGAIDATSITISSPVKGSCSHGFDRSGHHPTSGSGSYPGTGAGGPPSGSYPSGGSGFPGFNGASFGIASGSVISLSGSKLTVKGTTRTGFGTSSSTKPKATEVTVKLSASTRFTADRSVAASTITKGQCVEVNGTSGNGGANIAATSIMLSTAGSSGCSTPGFFGR